MKELTTIDEMRADVRERKSGFEIHDLLDRCACLVRLEKRTEICKDHHNSLHGSREHPDADVFKVGFNCDDAVYNKGSKIYMLPQGLNTAWGNTPCLAAGMAIRMLDYQNIYTQCPECRHTQWDLDFEAIPLASAQKCRLCGNRRDLD